MKAAAYKGEAAEDDEEEGEEELEEDYLDDATGSEDADSCDYVDRAEEVSLVAERPQGGMPRSERKKALAGELYAYNEYK